MAVRDECIRHERPDSLDERLALIAEFADALTDFLSGDGWHLADSIRAVARGTRSVDEARAEVERLH